jgi:membrane protease YdiL (CAAX protease family)
MDVSVIDNSKFGNGNGIANAVSVEAANGPRRGRDSTPPAENEGCVGVMRDFIHRHAALIYFAITFIISWGGMLLIIGEHGSSQGSGEQTNPLVYLAMVAGPTVAGLLMTGLVHGRTGLCDFRSRLFRWRVGTRWYAVALITAPLVAALTLLALLPASPVFMPAIMATGDTLALVMSGIMAGLMVGIFEELGWTGFVIPELRKRHSILYTGLLVGILWGVWHLILFFWTSGGFSGTFSIELFLPAVLFCEGVLPAYRVLMVYVYDRTGSLLVGILMHVSFTGGVAMILMPLTISGMPLVAWYFVLIAALWSAAAFAVTKGKLPSPQPVSRGVA